VIGGVSFTPNWKGRRGKEGETQKIKPIRGMGGYKLLKGPTFQGPCVKVTTTLVVKWKQSLFYKSGKMRMERGNERLQY